MSDTRTPDEIQADVVAAMLDGALSPARKRNDRAFQNTALQILCRAFPDGADVGMEEWRAWYKPESWLSAERALGAFIAHRLESERAALTTLRSAVREYIAAWDTNVVDANEYVARSHRRAAALSSLRALTTEGT